MLLRALLWALLLAIGPAIGVAGSDVATLTDATFAKTIESEPLVLVKFYAPWCGHCQSMKEDFERAATALKGKAVLADVDATSERKLASEYNIEGFPTLKLFAGGRELVDYKGERDKDSMVSFVERATKPAFDALSSADALAKWTADTAGRFRVIGLALDDDQKPTFTKTSFGLRDVMADAYSFANLEDVALVKELPNADKIEAKAGSFVLLTADDRTLLFDKEKHKELEKWIRGESVPVFGEFTQSNANMYTELVYPICAVFTKGSDKDTKLLEVVEKVAQKKRGSGKIAFVWVDNEKLDSFQDYVGLKGKDPALCVYSFETDLKYVLPEDFKLSEEALESWIDEVLAGKVDPLLKSEPIPEKNEDPVKIVVGDSWKDIVEDETKDVLISHTAPWCSHCQALKPIYEKVAKALVGIKTLVVANMDASENDPPVEYRATEYPTIQFFPAGKDAKMLAYDDERSSKMIIEFLKKNVVHKFEFDVETLGEDPEPEDAADDYEDDDEDYEAEEEGEEEGEGKAEAEAAAASGEEKKEL